MKYLIEQHFKKEEIENIIYEFRKRQILLMILFVAELFGLILFGFISFKSYEIGMTTTISLSIVSLISICIFTCIYTQRFYQV